MCAGAPHNEEGDRDLCVDVDEVRFGLDPDSATARLQIIKNGLKDIRMKSSEAPVDPDVSVVAARGVSNEAVGAQEAAEAGSLGTAGRQVFGLVNDDARKRSRALPESAESFQNLVVGQALAAVADDRLGSIEEHPIYKRRKHSF